MRMSEPATIPPPRTRFSSWMPVEMRSSSASSMSAMEVGVDFRDGLEVLDFSDFPCRSSTKLFQAPQSGHLPTHLSDCRPHDWHWKTVLSLGGLIRVLLLCYVTSCIYKQHLYYYSRIHGKFVVTENIAVMIEG